MNQAPELKVLSPEELQNKVCVVVGTRPGIIMFSPFVPAGQLLCVIGTFGSDPSAEALP